MLSLPKTGAAKKTRWLLVVVVVVVEVVVVVVETLSIPQYQKGFNVYICYA